MAILERTQGLLVCLLLLAGGQLSQAAWIWVEGEDAESTDIGKHPWYYGQTDKQQLSGGEFLAHFDDGQEGHAEYAVTIPEAGRYHLWLRVNPVQSSLKLGIDGQGPAPVDFDAGRTGDINIAADKAADLRFLTWCRAGPFELSPGTHRLRFIMDSPKHHHGALDCFVLVNEPFSPMGALKPDQIAAHLESLAKENEGWVPWNPGKDDVYKSPIDLRHLNESAAGQSGWVITKDGQFILGTSGKPVRFWGVNGPPEGLRGRDLEACARLLAKYGVNLVRMHGSVFNGKTGVFRPEAITQKQEAVRAMKGQGIYSLLSIYFPLWMTPEDGPGWREGYDGRKHPFALLMFESEFQELYQSWWKQLLTTPGSDGRTLLEEPALMALEIQNEDSFFFWTFNEKNIPDPQLRKLEKRFGDWAAGHYGSIEKALAAWNGLALDRDDPGAGRLAMRPLYNMFREKTARDRDTAAFLAETQRTFYKGMIRYFREELGYKGLITCSNWTTANNDIFGPLEKYSYLAGDFIDRHGYFGCNHKGEHSAWSIRPDHTYSDRSAFRFDPEEPGNGPLFSHPVMDPTYNRMPSMISETAWNRPNRYRSEAPLFYAAYGCLQDTDAFAHFALDGVNWEVKPRTFMQPWTLMAPTQFGQFPAAALVYRLGLLQPGKMMVDLSLKLEDALALKGSSLSRKAHLDELRKSGPEFPEAPGNGVDPLVHFVGQTNLTITEEEGPSRIESLHTFIDRTAGIVTSSTGEITLDYGKGILRLDAPSVQGAGGNLREAGPVELKDIRIESGMDLIHVVVVALDGQSLATSSRMLLQVMTEEKPAGFATEPAGGGNLRITSLGHDPWLVRTPQGRVAFKRADAAALQVQPLDFNGYPAGAAGTADDIQFQPSAVYYLITFGR